MSRAIRILVVDDEQHVRASIAGWFRDEGYEVATASSGREALQIASELPPDILLVDIKMPEMDGLEVQRRVHALLPEATVIVMTAYAAVDTAVQALKDGAYDYVVKPFDPEELSRLVNKAAERYALVRENRALRERLGATDPEIISAPQGAMQAVLAQADRVAPTDTNVLLSGESGTGKELLARRIYLRSERNLGALVIVNCGALADSVLESELFGHEKGAFTGALGRRQGKLEHAHEGTLFLDEVADIPPKMQVDLLRAIEERQVVRVGGNTPVSTDFRLIAASNRDLEAEVAAGRFREDLFFRIHVFHIHLPPLRERTEDIPPLARAFAAELAEQMQRPIEGIAPEAMKALMSHPWPGNVRELRNAVERAVVVCRGRRLLLENFPFAGGPRDEDFTLARMEELHIRRVLSTFGFNVSRAASELGIDRVTLYNKMKKYGIRRP